MNPPGELHIVVASNNPVKIRAIPGGFAWMPFLGGIAFLLASGPDVRQPRSGM
jgi:hypothetical protein